MDIFCDNAAGNLLVSLASSTPLSILKVGELAIDGCNLWLCDPPASVGLPYAPAAIPAGFTKAIVAGRTVDDVEGESEGADDLFSMIVDASDLTGAGQTLHYAGTLNLNVAALTAALAGERTLPVLIDVSLENDDATAVRRLVMQADGLAYRAVYRFAEGAPTSGDPLYPAPTSLLTSGVDTTTIQRGTVALGSALASKAIAFTTPFTAAPTTVLAWLLPITGGAIIECAVLSDSITTAGFTAAFGAATPDTTYKLSWLALQ